MCRTVKGDYILCQDRALLEPAVLIFFAADKVSETGVIPAEQLLKCIEIGIR